MKGVYVQPDIPLNVIHHGPGHMLTGQPESQLLQKEPLCYQVPGLSSLSRQIEAFVRPYPGEASDKSSGHQLCKFQTNSEPGKLERLLTRVSAINLPAVRDTVKVTFSWYVPEQALAQEL
ncbi:hypothetical protein SRHO_G00210510 [Serrasalmus rhombeus]